MSKRPVLIIGPLPPPVGGARVSFKLFLDYILSSTNVPFRHFDLPVISDKVVDHLKTLLRMLNAIFFMPFSHSVVVFGSRNFCFSYGLVFLLASKCFGRKCSIRFFGGRPMLAFIHQKSFIRIFVLTIFRLVDRILLQTAIGAAEFPKALQNKIGVIHGYRPLMAQAISRKQHYDEYVRFVFIGSITEDKGVEILLKAFKSLTAINEIKKQLELHIYGSGSETITSRMSHTKGVFCHGQVDNSSLRHVLSSYDILILPSLYDNEGHPGAIIEAFMAGLPVIASSLPGICEIVYDEKNGILVEPGDVEGLSMAMLRIVDNRELTNNMAMNALRDSVRFDAKVILPRLARAFNIPL